MNYDGFMLSAADHLRHRTHCGLHKPCLFTLQVKQCLLQSGLYFSLLFVGKTHGFQACHATSPCWHLPEFGQFLPGDRFICFKILQIRCIVYCRFDSWTLTSAAQIWEACLFAMQTVQTIIFICILSFTVSVLFLQSTNKKRPTAYFCCIILFLFLLCRTEITINFNSQPIYYT